MPIYLSKTGYGYTYKKDKQSKKNKDKFIFKIIVLIFTIVIIFFLIMIFSKLLNKNSNVSERDLYALKILTTSSFDEATITSNYVKNQGASGYIYTENNEYIVFLSCYTNNEDANSVMKSLNENGYKVSIFKIQFPQISSSDNFFNETLNIFYDTYKNLYDLSIKYDKNELNNDDFKNNLNMLIKTNEQIINNFNDYYKNNSLSQIVYTKIYLQLLNENLNELYNKNNNLNTEIKSHYFYVIFLYKQLLQNIQ